MTFSELDTFTVLATVALDALVAFWLSGKESVAVTDRVLEAGRSSVAEVESGRLEAVASSSVPVEVVSFFPKRFFSGLSSVAPVESVPGVTGSLVASAKEPVAEGSVMLLCGACVLGVILSELEGGSEGGLTVCSEGATSSVVWGGAVVGGSVVCSFGGGEVDGDVDEGVEGGVEGGVVRGGRAVVEDLVSKRHDSDIN